MSREIHLAVLGLSGDPSKAQIKAAYKKLALKYHPDLNKAKNASAKMSAINVAYAALQKQAPSKTAPTSEGRTERRWTVTLGGQATEVREFSRYTYKGRTYTGAALVALIEAEIKAEAKSRQAQAAAAARRRMEEQARKEAEEAERRSRPWWKKIID